MDDFTAALVAASRRYTSAPAPALVTSPADLVAGGEPGAFVLPGTTWTELYQETGGAAATTPAGVDDPVGTIHDTVTDSYWTVPTDADRPTLRADAAGRRYLDIPRGVVPMKVMKPILNDGATGMLVVFGADPSEVDGYNGYSDVSQYRFQDGDFRAWRAGDTDGGVQHVEFTPPDDGDDRFEITDPAWAGLSRSVVAGWFEGAGSTAKAQIDDGPIAEARLPIPAGTSWSGAAFVALGGSFDNDRSTIPTRLYGLIAVRGYAAERLAFAKTFIRELTHGTPVPTRADVEAIAEVGAVMAVDPARLLRDDGTTPVATDGDAVGKWASSDAGVVFDQAGYGGTLTYHDDGTSRWLEGDGDYALYTTSVPVDWIGNSLWVAVAAAGIVGAGSTANVFTIQDAGSQWFRNRIQIKPDGRVAMAVKSAAASDTIERAGTPGTPFVAEALFDVGDGTADFVVDGAAVGSSAPATTYVPVAGDSFNFFARWWDGGDVLENGPCRIYGAVIAVGEPSAAAKATIRAWLRGLTP